MSIATNKGIKHLSDNEIKTIRVAYFKEGVDKRDNFNEWYVIEETVKYINELTK